MKDLIVQTIGVLAFIILMISYYQKKKEKILIVQIFSSLAFAIHYYFLDGLTGTVSNLFCILMFIIIFLFDKKGYKSKWILVVILMPVLLVSTIFTWENISSLLPIFATTLALISFIFDSETFIRIVGIITAASWTIYGFVYMSYPSIIFNSVTIISTIISIIRNRKK